MASIRPEYSQLTSPTLLKYGRGSILNTMLLKYGALSYAILLRGTLSSMGSAAPRAR